MSDVDIEKYRQTLIKQSNNITYNLWGIGWNFIKNDRLEGGSHSEVRLVLCSELAFSKQLSVFHFTTKNKNYCVDIT